MCDEPSTRCPIITFHTFPQSAAHPPSEIAAPRDRFPFPCQAPRAAESEARLKRLYDAIEAGVAEFDDPALKDRIDGVKAIRDQAKADAERAQAMLENSGSKAVTPQMVRTFVETARRHIRPEGGGYRRDHLRALASKSRMARSGSWDRSPGFYRC